MAVLPFPFGKAGFRWLLQRALCLRHNRLQVGALGRRGFPVSGIPGGNPGDATGWMVAFPARKQLRQWRPDPWLGFPSSPGLVLSPLVLTGEEKFTLSSLNYIIGMGSIRQTTYSPLGKSAYDQTRKPRPGPEAAGCGLPVMKKYEIFFCSMIPKNVT
jgi:hypothetical protein